MQKLEVLIEENAFGSVRPVEVVADAPVGALVPALVEELQLPQTDLFGKKLVYMLRHSSGGRILPEQSTLLASGVEPGARLALDSYVLDGSVATLVQNSPVATPLDPALHSSATLADADSFAPLNVRNTTGNLPPVKKKRRKLARRTFLIFGAAVLGVGGTGLGYAAYRAYNGDPLYPNTMNTRNVPQTGAPPQSAKTTAKPPFPTTAQATFTFTNHKQVVRSVSWSPVGNLLASGADDAHVFIWSPNGAVQHDIPHPGSVQTLAWAPDGQRLVTGAQNQVAFYSVQNAMMLAAHHHAGAVTDVAWATHNQMQVVSAGQDNRAIVWNTNNYQRQTTFRRHTTPVLGVSWSADGQVVASGTQQGIIRVWQGNNAQEIHGGYFIKVPVRALAFAPIGGQLAAGGDDGTVHIWNGLTCQQQENATIANQCVDTPLMLQASNTAVRSLAWSLDGRFLAVGTADGKITIWYPSHDQQKPIVMAQQNHTVHGLAWSPQGDQLASAGTAVTIWKLM
ncbi:MAG: hypothetical protein JO011_21125 [Ktedonobacteraceae bacterium]|nr:hypothetical protein [Ktedonobacteraceae bacterium]